MPASETVCERRPGVVLDAVVCGCAIGYSKVGQKRLRASRSGYLARFFIDCDPGEVEFIWCVLLRFKHFLQVLKLSLIWGQDFRFNAAAGASLRRQSVVCPFFRVLVDFHYVRIRGGSFWVGRKLHLTECAVPWALSQISIVEIPSKRGMYPHSVRLHHPAGNGDFSAWQWC